MILLDETIEREKLAFLGDLRTQFPKIDIEQLSIASAGIERLIEARILERVLSNIGRILRDPQLYARGSYLRFKGYDFELCVTEDFKKEGSLVYSCLCRTTSEKPKLFELKFALDQPGRYKRVIFCLPTIIGSID